MPVLQLPDVRVGRAAHGVCIGNIKDILHTLRLGGIVDEGDALRAAIDPAPNLLIPRFQRRAGRRFGALGVDQKLLQKAVSVHPRSGIHEKHPVLRGTADGTCLAIGQISDIIQFRHSDHLFVMIWRENAQSSSRSSSLSLYSMPSSSSS